MANNLQITFTLAPELNVPKLNAVLSELKKSLGKHGKDIKLIDEAAVNQALKGATAGTQQLRTELDKTGKAGQQAGTVIKQSFGSKALQFSGVIYSVQAITGAFERFLGPYKEFDKQLRNIGTLGVKNFEGFRNAAIDLAKEVPDTVAGVTNSIYNAISAGAIKVVDGNADIAGGMELIKTASQLSVAGLTDTNSAVKGLAANLNAYGESMDQATRYSDILFNTVNNGVTTIPELNASLANVVPTAAAFGVSFEQVNAAIATMTKQGVPTAQATTKIRSALVELSKPGANLKKIMDAAGVSLASLRQEGLQVTFEKLGKAMDTAGVSANQVFSRVEGATAALALGGKHAKDFADILATYTTDAIGSTQRAFDIANEGIGVGVQGWLNQIEAAFFKAFNVIGDGATAALAFANQLAPIAVSFAAIGQVIPTGAIKSMALSMLQFLVPAMVTTEAETGKLILSKNALTFATIKARAASMWEAASMSVTNAARSLQITVLMSYAAAKEFVNGLTLKGIVVGIAHTAMLGAKSIALGVVTAAQWLWNAALNANPLGMAIMATAAFIAITKALSDVLHTTSAERVE
jgi:TP901 family phage tail tape measure protein